jgi:hypothetical protein
MARRRSLRIEFGETVLERRELLAQAAALAAPALVADPAVAAQADAAAPGNLFHQNGINGLKLDKSFVDTMNRRFNIGKQMASRTFEAFQVFEDAYISPPPTPPPPSSPGNPAMPPTLPNLVNQLEHFVALALSTFEATNNQTRPSVVTSPKFSQRAFNILVPFAVAQIEQMSASLSVLPPHGGTGATLAHARQVINVAYNAILNAIAEYSLHPNLFTSPGDFYISPDIFFPTSFNGNPATAAPGYFVRGPGGQLLPGAILHPHIMLAMAGG